MATPSARPGANGSNSTGPAPSRNRDLGSLRSGEPGSAFRGLVKGRGTDRGGGRGGGRGGRGGRSASRGGRAGGAQTNGTKPDSSGSKDEVSTAQQLSPITGPSNSATDKPSAPSPNTERAPRPKGNSRRSSRNVPALVVEPSPPNSETLTATVSSAPSTRRRSSRQHRKSTTGAGPSRHSLVVDASQTLLAPPRAHTGPPSPATQFKDVPPHSSGPETTTFDMKYSIDALVERVRAVAMDSNRPTTPGSHIDWAGDEDDSLPDLNDWGITTSTSVAGDKISPILVDGLKSLPDDREGTKKSDKPVNPVVIVSQATEKTAAADEKGTSKRAISTRAPQPAPETGIVLKPISSLSLTTKTAEDHASAAEPMTVLPSLPSGPPARPSEKSRVPIHPSLPPKPVAAVESVPAPSKPRSTTAPIAVPLPVRQPVIEKPSTPLESVVTTVDVVLTTEQPSVAVVKLPLSPPLTAENSLQPVSLPHGANSGADLSVDDISHKLGLSASIHAPSSMPEATSLPSFLQSTPTGRPTFNPTHQRAHTVGRPHGHPQQTPHTFQSHVSRSASRGGFDAGMRHGRTHSSPPAGSRLNPRIHSRPVLTVDALSQIARRIGGTPTRAKEVSIAKE